MGAIAAATRAVEVLRRNPVLFAAAVLFALLSLPSYAIQETGIPFLSFAWAGVAFFITPFLVGGFIGMAAEGLEGTTSFSTFVDAGTSNYVNLLLVALLLLVIIGGIAFVGGIALAVIGIFVFGISASGGMNAGTGALAIVGLLVLLYLLVIIALSVLLQFVYQAVVVDQVGPVEAVKQSYRTVRGNLVGAVGVAFIAFLLSGVLGSGPVTIATMSLQPTGPETFTIPLSRGAAYGFIFGWGTISTVVFGAFNNTMLVAFYDAYAPTPAE